MESKPGRMYDLLPAIHFIPAVNHKQALCTYACPVYKTAVRKGNITYILILKWCMLFVNLYPWLMLCPWLTWCPYVTPALITLISLTLTFFSLSLSRSPQHHRHVHELCRAYRAAYIALRDGAEMDSGRGSCPVQSHWLMDWLMDCNSICYYTELNRRVIHKR